MSLGLIMNIANSGINAAQSQLRVVSDNVTNVNTPGYVRKIADQQSMTTQGTGTGVEIARVRLATDRFLQAASLSAGADAGRETVRYELYDRIQSLFGDPGGDSSFFTRIDSLFSVFASTAEMPTSTASRQDAIWKAQALFDEAGRVSGQIQAVREDADGRLQSAVDNVNGLLDQIAKLNQEIARATVVGADATGAENAQLSLVNQLSEYMDIRITQRSVGGVEIRTGAGLMLVSTEAGKLEYGRAGAVSAQTNFNDIYVREPGGQPRSLSEGLVSGEIKGLLQIRDVDAPAVAEQMAELTTRLADELNRAHNASTSLPAPSVMTGRNTGMSLATALEGFSGTTTITAVNPNGVIQNRAEIVFNGANITINGTATTPANFLATLNAQMPGVTATFDGGQLKLEAANGNGIAIADSATNGATKAGRGFSHYFGLNDLVSTDKPAIYDTGLKATSEHGFAAGQSLTFRFTTTDGARLRDMQFVVPATATTMQGLINSLNDPVSGIGRNGTFSLSNTGELVFNGRGSPPAQMSVLNDVTQQADSGVSMSELFGLGGERANRSATFSIRSDIATDPTRLALAQLDLNATATQPAISAADGRGARLLAAAGEYTSKFGSAGGISGAVTTLSRYASDMAGVIGSKANLAQSAATGAEALYQEATARRSSFEGVNLEEELVLMTTYQQAFNASARLIQAAAEMYDTLLGMVR